ncbi:MAG: hypothetical protein R3321_14090, partial [Nitrososphaeraceae archaeon]|nr:hypothetical protein [Nitrososphaeraceae archaeon]
VLIKGVLKRFLILCWMILLASCDKNPVNQSSTYLAPLGDPIAESVLWSPVDDSLILVSAGYADFMEKEIYILNIKTKEKNIIAQTNRGILSAQAWSPDGKQIILSAFQDTVGFEDGGLWRFDITSTDIEYFHEEPSNLIWGPEKDQLIFDRVKKTKNEKIITELVLMDSETQQEMILYSTEPESGIAGFSLSPDGKKLVFAVGNSDPIMTNTDIYILDLVSRDITTILSGGDNKYPVWSPINDFVVVVNKRYDGVEAVYSYLFINSTTACNFFAFESNLLFPPSWSPDGSYLAYIDFDKDGIYLFNVNSFFQGNEQAHRCL